MRWVTVAVACGLTVGLAGCSDTGPAAAPQFVAPSPAVAFAAITCPPALGTMQDVVPSGPRSSHLLDPDTRPVRALVCEYGSVFDQGPGSDHTLAKQIELAAAPARRLASAVAHIDVGGAGGAGGAADCPDDTGKVTVLVFDSGGTDPVDLWWHTTGCQTIDNGVIEARQIGNDSFGRFQNVFAATTRPAT